VDQAKRAFQVLSFGGSVSTWLKLVDLTGNQWRPLDAFEAEMHAVRRALLASPIGQRYAAKWPSDTPALRQVALIVQDHERQVTAAMMEFFQANGYCVGVYVFDGVQVERRGPGPLDLAVLCACEQHIEKQTGLSVKLKEKSMEPTAADLQTLRDSARIHRTETDAAREVLLHRGDRIVHTAVGLALFDARWGTFCVDPVRNESVVLASVMAGLEHRMQGSRGHFLNSAERIRINTARGAT
jgi:hypothetical protein